MKTSARAIVEQTGSRGHVNREPSRASATRRAHPGTGAVAHARRATERYVMVVEDEPDISELLLSVFAAEGYEAAPALDAEAALQLARGRRPDAITLDLGLPGRDGQELLRELKSDPETRDVPVIVVSAYSAALSSDDRQLIAAIVDKPFELGRLLKVMRCVLQAGGR